MSFNPFPPHGTHQFHPAVPPHLLLFSPCCPSSICFHTEMRSCNFLYLFFPFTQRFGSENHQLRLVLSWSDFAGASRINFPLLDTQAAIPAPPSSILPGKFLQHPPQVVLWCSRSLLAPAPACENQEGIFQQLPRVCCCFHLLQNTDQMNLPVPANKGGSQR